MLALRDEESLDAFAAEHEISRADAEQRSRARELVRAIADAEAADAVPEAVASLLRQAVDVVPAWLLLQTLETVRGFLP